MLFRSARIVEAGDSFAKNLGIRLSMGTVELETKKDSNTGNLTYTFKPTDKAFIANNYTGHKGSVNLPATPRASKRFFLITMTSIFHIPVYIES